MKYIYLPMYSVNAMSIFKFNIFFHDSLIQNSMILPDLFYFNKFQV